MEEREKESNDESKNETTAKITVSPVETNSTKKGKKPAPLNLKKNEELTPEEEKAIKEKLTLRIIIHTPKEKNDLEKLTQKKLRK